MNQDPIEIMTVEETAEFLRVPVSSVYKMAQQGKIPAQKVGRHWRFYLPTIKLWMSGTGINNVNQGEPTEMS